MRAQRWGDHINDEDAAKAAIRAICGTSHFIDEVMKRIRAELGYKGLIAMTNSGRPGSASNDDRLTLQNGVVIMIEVYGPDGNCIRL